MKALKRTPEESTDAWDLAIERVRRQHQHRLGMSPKKPRKKTADTWYKATRSLWTQHLKRVERAYDPWTAKIRELVTRSKKGKAKRPEKSPLRIGLCPKCRKVPEWARRCMDHHRVAVSWANTDAWERKMLAIAAGDRHREAIRFKRPKEKEAIDPGDVEAAWSIGMKDAVKRHNARQRWRNADDWTKWASNSASNLRKRMRRKAVAKRKQQIAAEKTR